ncbi:MAG: HD-GYP domain-containing protein [Treponema sp.]|jgi:HD-GYP domain-containing protein (c-di-GMP phosphodiesterase class II)|nr:HD-GYP domain-containing protein [Treponema sp.]
MSSFTVNNIPSNSYFTKPSYIDNRFIVTAPEMPFTKELKQALTVWDFKEISSGGENQAEYSSLSPGGSGGGETAGETGLNDGDQIEQARDFYLTLQQYVETLFTQIAVTGDLEFKAVAVKVKDACDFIKEKRRYLLRVIENSGDSGQAGSRNYLVAHTVTSTIISIIIGSYLKLPSHRLIELGVAALLHETGMLKLPPQIYLNKRALTPQERKAILTHPILSYKMLKSFGFPLVISLASLEHHERENGEGYPQKLMGNRISLYAKIIAVACSYEALTNARPHKDAKDGHTGILDLLKNEGKQYDDTVVRALVYSLSLYPIGLYVLLSNGKKGQVIDVNPENPQFPIVQLLDEFTPDGRNKTVETSHGGLNIVRPLVREEIGTSPKTD